MAKKSLQRELHKRRPFGSPEQEAVLSILRTSDRIQNRIARLFRQFELTSSQYNVLRILRGEGKPMSCQEITQRMIQAVPAMTGLLDRLEHQTLISRQRSSEDRRVIYVQLTPKAISLLERMDKPVDEMHRRLVGHLSRPELVQLSALLERAREHLP